jgi:hypothetical protein
MTLRGHFDCEEGFLGDGLRLHLHTLSRHDDFNDMLMS